MGFFDWMNDKLDDWFGDDEQEGPGDYDPFKDPDRRGRGGAVELTDEEARDWYGD